MKRDDSRAARCGQVRLYEAVDLGAAPPGTPRLDRAARSLDTVAGAQHDATAAVPHEPTATVLAQFGFRSPDRNIDPAVAADEHDASVADADRAFETCLTSKANGGDELRGRRDMSQSVRHMLARSEAERCICRSKAVDCSARQTEDVSAPRLHGIRQLASRCSVGNPMPSSRVESRCRIVSGNTAGSWRGENGDACHGYSIYRHENGVIRILECIVDMNNSPRDASRRRR